MVKILGLDISSVSTGYCIINNGRLLKNAIGTITLNSKLEMGDKLLQFENKVKELIKKYKPNYIIIEDIFRGPNIKTFKTLAMFRGVCFKVVFEETGKNPVSMMPTEARKVVGTTGTKKEDAFDFIIKKYSLASYEFCTHNDVTDAIILALAYNELHKNGTNETYFTQNTKKKRKRKKSK